MLKKFLAPLTSLALMISLIGFASCSTSTGPDSSGTVTDPTDDGSTTIVAVTGVTLSSATATILAGGTLTLTAAVAPADATNAAVTWSSDNAAVATVDKGVVTGVAAGTAVITVKSDADATMTASCAVTVKPASIGVSMTTMNLSDLTVINTADWGGGVGTTPTAVTDIHNRANAIQYTLSSSANWYGCFWQGSDPAKNLIDVSAYAYLYFTYYDAGLTYTKDASDTSSGTTVAGGINDMIVKLESWNSSGAAAVYAANIANLSAYKVATDSDGWTSYKIPLSAVKTAVSDFNLAKIYVVGLSNQGFNPGLAGVAPYLLNGSFYISDFHFGN